MKQVKSENKTITSKINVGSLAESQFGGTGQFRVSQMVQDYNEANRGLSPHEYMSDSELYVPGNRMGKSHGLSPPSRGGGFRNKVRWNMSTKADPNQTGGDSAGIDIS